jgi:hypothetical protein
MCARVGNRKMSWKNRRETRVSTRVESIPFCDYATFVALVARKVRGQGLWRLSQSLGNLEPAPPKLLLCRVLELLAGAAFDGP